MSRHLGVGPWRLKDSARARRAGLIGVAGLATLLVAIAAAIAMVGQLDGKILPGVRVGSLDLGGVSVADARHHLLQRYAALGQGQIAVETPSGRASMTFTEIGRGLDVDATVASAMAAGRASDPVGTLLGVITTAVQRRDIELVVKLDHAALKARLGAIARMTRTTPHDAAVETRGGTFEVTPAAAGQSIDEATIAKTLIGELHDPTVPADVTVPVTYRSTEPQRTNADAQWAAEAAERIAADLAVTSGSSTYTIGTGRIDGAISFGSLPDGRYGPSVDVEALRADVERIAAEVNVAAVNAAFVVDGPGKPSGVRASKDGAALNVDKTLDAIGSVLVARRDGRTAPAPIAAIVDRVAPALSADQARANLPGMAKVSSWTVPFTPGESNGYGANIRIPAGNIDGTVVLQGEIFSFFKAVGPIDEAHGFRQGGVIKDGKSYPTGAIGGGICTASTTMFNAALRGGFEIVERQAHYYFIKRYPIGLDATVYSNGNSTVDLRWRNDSAYPILIRGYADNGSITFELWTVPDGRNVAPIPASPPVWNVVKASSRVEYVTTLKPGQRYQEEYPADGYDTVVGRTVTDASGRVIHQDTFRSHYSKVDGVLLIGVDSATPKPSSPPSR